MRLRVTAIILMIAALCPSWTFAQVGRPSWVDTNAANYPAQVGTIVFPNGVMWDDDHPSIVLGPWRLTRSAPLTEKLSSTQMGPGVSCINRPDHSDCFYAIIMLFSCYNSAIPTATSCAMALSWSPHDGAICEVHAGPQPPSNYFPELGISFRIACPTEVHFVN